MVQRFPTISVFLLLPLLPGGILCAQIVPTPQNRETALYSSTPQSTSSAETYADAYVTDSQESNDLESSTGRILGRMPSLGWITHSPHGPRFEGTSDPSGDDWPSGEPMLYPPYPADYWQWQILPDGVIYHSYLAGPREPRISTVIFEERDGRTLWDPIVGGRIPVLRFGNDDPLYPQGWQLDVEGAAILRLNLDQRRDVESSDFRFGFPITYGVNQWQFKFGYYHLSSHLGDEFIVRNGPPIARVNYVRDSVFVGASFLPLPAVRLYAEAAYAAFFTAGGAQPWEFQFGIEFAQPGMTGPHGTPFLATNAHLREELDFGGDITLQAGWLWRGSSGHVFRTGLHYMNGKSTQYQFFRDSEQQIGFGIWYDY